VHSRYPNDPRVSRAARMAREAGYRVDVICLREPDRPSREVVDGVGVQRLPLSHRRGVGAPLLAMEYLAFTLMATVAVAVRSGREGYAIVHVHNPPDFLVVAALVPRLRGARVLFDIHDLSPLMFGARFETGGESALRAITAVERAACGFADGVITVHEPYVEELASHGVDAAKVTIVMNTQDERVIAAARERGAQRDEASAAAWTAIYHGTITEWYGVPLLVRAAALAQAQIPDLRLEIVGDGDDLPQAHAVCDELGLGDRVMFSDRYLPIAEVLERAAVADCGVVPNLDSPLNELTLSSKLLEYVALGVPVVVARLRTLAHHFSDDEVTFFEPGDAQGLADALQWVAEHPDEARAKAERARRRAEAYSWDENRERYVALLSSLVAG
jgi:glycosyltransferase involved in cell wall biosynthesis